MSEVTRIQEEEVFQAIEQLLVAGKTPTHLTVRAQLGGRGSGPVLSRLIALWFNEHGPNCVAGAVEARGRKPVEDLGAQVRQMLKDAERQVSDAERDRKATLDAREQQLQELAVLLESREAALIAAQSKLADREAEQAHLLAELRSDKASLANQLQQAREAQENWQRDRLDADAATSSQIAELREKCGHFNARVIALEAELHQANERYSDAILAADHARAAQSQTLAALAKREAAEGEARQQLHEQLSKLGEANTLLQRDYADRYTALSESAADRERSLRAQLQQTAEALVVSDQRSAVLAQELKSVAHHAAERDAARGQVEALTAALSELARKVPDPIQPTGKDGGPGPNSSPS
jgi:hypothetical protein